MFGCFYTLSSGPVPVGDRAGAGLSALARARFRLGGTQIAKRCGVVATARTQLSAPVAESLRQQGRSLGREVRHPQGSPGAERLRQQAWSLRAGVALLA
jgi:hypothetical protein